MSTRPGTKFFGATNASQLSQLNYVTASIDRIDVGAIMIWQLAAIYFAESPHLIVEQLRRIFQSVS